MSGHADINRCSWADGGPELQTYHEAAGLVDDHLVDCFRRSLPRSP